MNLKRIMAAVILCMCTHISYGAGKDAVDQDLRKAIDKKDDKQVAALLSQGADPVFSRYGTTALDIVINPGRDPFKAAKGNYKMFKLMFDQIKPDKRKEIINEALIKDAISGGDKQIIADLIAAKPNTVNMQNVFSYMQQTPYDKELWDIALKAGASINGNDSAGNTPLEAAIPQVIQDAPGTEENIKALIKAGATVKESYIVWPRQTRHGGRRAQTKLEDVTADNLLSKVLKFAGRPEIVIEERKGAGAGGAGAAGR